MKRTVYCEAASTSSDWTKKNEQQLRKAQTKPTLETVLERINSLGANLEERLGTLQSDFGAMKVDVCALRNDVDSVKIDVGGLRNEFQLFRGETEIRMDRIEGITNETRGEMLNLRADFREWKDQLKESMA